jgi:N-acyl amino acid synthase of PEP-CTERM/exosortase system
MVTAQILDSYNRYFYVTYATTEAQRELAYRIRYQVYCREFRYEREEDYPDQMERDEYDDQAWHCILMHKLSDSAVGCVRLIGPCEEGPTSLLPFERSCSHALNEQIFDLSTLPRDSFGEISRLAVLQNFRRRKSDEKKPISFPDQQMLAKSGRSHFPLISISLSLGILSMLLNSGLKYGFAMMEPRLTRMLKRYGIVFNQIGDVTDHHGMRGPFVIEKYMILPNLSLNVFGLFKTIDRQLFPGT